MYKKSKLPKNKLHEKFARFQLNININFLFCRNSYRKLTGKTFQCPDFNWWHTYIRTWLNPRN